MASLIFICCENWLSMMGIIYLAWSPQSNKMSVNFNFHYQMLAGLWAYLPALIMSRYCHRCHASLMLKPSCSNCCDVKEHNWWPLIPLSAERLTEVRLNSCTVHSAQRYTWSSVHWVGSGRGGRYIKTRVYNRIKTMAKGKGWPSLVPTSSFWLVTVSKTGEAWDICDDKK